MSNDKSDSLVASYRALLEECRDLYRSSGRECVERHPDLLEEQDRKRFTGLMDDLHKGLLLKIYITIVRADGRWSAEEQRLGKVLFLHVWDRDLAGEELKAAALNVAKYADSLTWYSLVRPFDQIAPLRSRIGRLETIIVRLANYVAKADNEVTEGEQAHLKELNDEMFRHLRSIPLDEPSQHAQAQELGSAAVQQMATDVEQMRSNCELAEQEGPGEASQETSEERLQRSMDELNELIGLQKIKDEIDTLTNFLKIQDQRRRAKLPVTKISRHMVFVGNPGTGKTTVARILGDIFGAMGLLEKGHLIETDRSGLVAEYAGQTAVKTHKKIDEALGGVLFIDEAYGLVNDSQDDPYGAEAVQALLKRIEDDRDRLGVILAGYPRPMQQLLESNPGLSSRFPRTFEFENFTATELGRIFGVMCQRNHYELPALARAKLLIGFRALLEQQDEHFGNGRLVRNIFETCIRRLANRIVDTVPLTKELLSVIEADDIQMRDAPVATWADLADDARLFHVVCPGCATESHLRQEHLGRRVKCKRCDDIFAAEWG
jgi:adenylate kinase family enzyme